MIRQILTITATAAIICSCGIYKKYERPETAVPGQALFGEDHITSDTSSIASTGWRDLFTDPYLRRLIESAMENNTDIKTAKLHTEQAELALKTARLAYLPNFNFAPEGGVSKFNNYNGVKSGPSRTYSVPVAASWEIDIFGKSTNAKRQSRATYDMMQDLEQAVESGLIAAIASQYYSLLMLDRQLEITESTADKFKKSADVLEAMKEAGMANDVAVMQMRGAYWQVVAGTESIKEAITGLENSLCSILGETPHGIERGNLEDISFPENLNTGIPVQILSRRPDVKAAEKSLASAYYAANAARAQMYPSLNLGGVAGWTNNLGSVINPGGLLLSASVSLLQPIFNARANANRAKIMKSQQEEALLDFKQTVLDAGVEVNNALSQYQRASDRMDSRRNQIEALKTAVEKTEYLMKYSPATYLDVLTAQQSLLSAENDLEQDRHDMISAVISLYRALGGR